MYEKLAEISKKLNRQSGFNNLPHLIFMTDDDAQPHPENIIEKLTANSMVILRDYDHPNRAELGEALCYICKAKGVRFLVAGDLALCLSLGADGIHLPEYRIGEAINIRADHEDLLITAAAHSEAAIEQVVKSGVDAILLSPIFPTKSHPQTLDDPGLSIGSDKLKIICGKYNHAIYALGGINENSVSALMGTGIVGIAAIRGLEA